MKPNTSSSVNAMQYAGGFDSAIGQSGTSIFDPVLCELAYTWFSPKGGIVIDPFAGGSVRGIVAALLWRQYIGIDLSERQINANREQAKKICKNLVPVWHVGDSKNISQICKGVDADFIFSCPPYYDLEVYSDNTNDLSNMSYEEFLKTYYSIIKDCAELLKNDRFACFVVGDIRDKKGMYRKLPWHTIQAFENAGMQLYNEAVLITSVGSLPIRVGKQFTSARKLGKTHQNIFVFCKGDPKKATEYIGGIT